jgi:long-subunit fatty acid transport protein
MAHERAAGPRHLGSSRGGPQPPLRAESAGPSPRRRARLTLCLLLLTTGLVLGRPCAASQLLAVAASAADTALSGATVAQPRTPTAALFANPAALALFDETTADGTAAIASARTEVDASLPPTYADDSSFLVVAPGFGLAVPRRAAGTGASAATAP